MEEEGGGKRRKFTAEEKLSVAGENEKEISAYLILRFCGGTTAAGIYEVKIGIREIGGGGGGAAAVIRGMESDLLDPLADFGVRLTEFVGGGVLGSDLYVFTGGLCWSPPFSPVMGPYIFNTETKKMCEPVRLPPIQPKSNAVVIPANDKFYILSNNFRCAGGFVPDPSFELFDPKSGSSEILPSPPFLSREFFRTYISGFVVVYDCILICLEQYKVGGLFFSYNLGSRKWKTVSKIEGIRYSVFRGNACVVGDNTVYGCSTGGVPIAYPFSVPSPEDVNSSDDVADIFLGKPVVCKDTAITGDKRSLIGTENHSARIAAIGKDMLCLVHVFESSPSLGIQHVSIKILQTHGPLSLKMLTSGYRAWNLKASYVSKLECCCIQAS